MRMSAFCRHTLMLNHLAAYKEICHKDLLCASQRSATRCNAIATRLQPDATFTTRCNAALRHSMCTTWCAALQRGVLRCNHAATQLNAVHPVAFRAISHTSTICTCHTEI
jgi:hypothetical protein